MENSRNLLKVLSVKLKMKIRVIIIKVLLGEKGTERER